MDKSYNRPRFIYIWNLYYFIYLPTLNDNKPSYSFDRNNIKIILILIFST